MSATALGAALAGGAIVSIHSASSGSWQSCFRVMSASIIYGGICLGINAVTGSELGTFMAALFLFVMLISYGDSAVTFFTNLLNDMFPKVSK